jgi:hypothetical protein
MLVSHISSHISSVTVRARRSTASLDAYAESLIRRAERNLPFPNSKHHKRARAASSAR